MATAFPHLFQPLKLGGRTLKNRIVFGAHTANMAEGGLPGERHLGYYRERALGGAAMIVVEPVPVHRTGVLTRGNFLPGDDAVIPHFRRITDVCKAEGTVMIQQLYHVGQHGDADNSFEANWSPSGLPSYHDSDGSHAVTEAEIEELIAAYIQAARRARAAGFDGVELFAAYHALIDQFWTPWSNRRGDRWGGSLENRTRFSRAIADGIRKSCGPDFIVGLAINYEPDVEVALNIEALQEVILHHDERGLIDYVTCGVGSYFDFYKLMPTFLYPEKLSLPLAEALKSVVRHAKVQSECHIRTPENADYVIASGAADMVSIVRGQIADPHLARKAAEGRPEDIRGCISCNQMCWGRRSRDYWISCLINPSAGREYLWGGDRFRPAETPRRILVVGGGPAGLECARVAAERGHRVTLAEASSELGGQFRLAGLQPRRGQVLELLDWYGRQLEKLQVTLDYNAPLEAGDVEAFDADAVVLATGSLPAETGFQKWLPAQENLDGLEKGRVWSVEDVMSRSCRLGKRVLLLDEGGNWRGCGTAWHLAEQGHKVTLATPDPMVGKELQRVAADLPLRRRLAGLGVTFVTEVLVRAWHGNAATLMSVLDGKTWREAADDLVLATTNVANSHLAEALAGSAKEIHAIGDCVAARQAPYAFYEGRRLGLRL
ncbi:MAG TPA: FAD-dependent oxidoreductase [Kiloniellaceae bacterium]|nr:FAD-dependent oxidoreductase [Kiloniellaceae bacterium]